MVNVSEGGGALRSSAFIREPSASMIDLPVIDLKRYKATGDATECAKAAESLHKYGVLCVRDEVCGCDQRSAMHDTNNRGVLVGSERPTRTTRRSSA